MNDAGLRRNVRRLARPGIPAALIAAALRPGAPARQRVAASAALGALWTTVYIRYRRRGHAETDRQYELLRTANWDAFTRHYNERVPTIEEEFDIWGAYHQHRHEMRYDLVAAAVRQHLPSSGSVLDVGCGSALVADRIVDLCGHYVGVDFGSHHIAYAAKKFGERQQPLDVSFGRANAELLPFPEASFDVVVLSEVIEHLLRPERSVWEIARVLRRGGVLIMTTNNASEVPLRSPLSHLLAWAEKALGATCPELISLRPWVWPHPVDAELLPEGSPPVYLPHTHHIQGETRRLLTAAGLETISWSTFEFPPPQSASAVWFDARGEVGRHLVDLIEALAQHVPLVKRLGCHLFMVARKVRSPVDAQAPSGLWPGPFSQAKVTA